MRGAIVLMGILACFLMLSGCVGEVSSCQNGQKIDQEGYGGCASIPDPCKEVSCGEGVCHRESDYYYCICPNGQLFDNVTCVPNQCNKQSDCDHKYGNDRKRHEICSIDNKCHADCGSNITCIGDGEICKEDGATGQFDECIAE